ncbi:hypothetical protein D3C79_806820 [compost metagenome]
MLIQRHFQQSFQPQQLNKRLYQSLHFQYAYVVPRSIRRLLIHVQSLNRRFRQLHALMVKHQVNSGTPLLDVDLQINQNACEYAISLFLDVIQVDYYPISDHLLPQVKLHRCFHTFQSSHLVMDYCVGRWQRLQLLHNLNGMYG